MRLWVLTFNVNFQSGLEFHCEVVIPDGDLLKPAFYQSLIEFRKAGRLFFDVILQVIDSCNLCASGSSVNSAFFTLLTELEDLVGNFIVGFLGVSFFEKLLLEVPLAVRQCHQRWSSVHL